MQEDNSENQQRRLRILTNHLKDENGVINKELCARIPVSTFV